MTVIKDGSGQGYLAKVGSDNDLHVRSISFAEISGASEEGLAFQAEGETTIVASTEKTILVMINNSENSLEIGNIFVSIKNETGKITTIKVYVGQVTATGGTSKEAINLNTGSLIDPDVTLLEDNPTISGTDHKILELYFLLQDTQTLFFDGGITLAQAGSFRVTCTGAAGAAGTYTADASFQFWQERDI